MSETTEEELVLDLSDHTKEEPARVMGEPTGTLNGSATEGERLIMACEEITWDNAEGFGNPEVRATK